MAGEGENSANTLWAEPDDRQIEMSAGGSPENDGNEESTQTPDDGGLTEEDMEMFEDDPAIPTE